MGRRTNSEDAGPERSLSMGDKLYRLQWFVLTVLAALGAIGVVALYSAADGSLSPWAEAHAGRIMIAIVIVLAVALVPREFWLTVAYPSYLATIGLLIAVPFFGSEAGGARRWIDIGGVSVQPSELMKVMLVLALARYYQWLPDRYVSQPIGLLAPLVMIGVPVTLTLLQPDLGTAFLLAFVGVGMMFLAGVHLGYFAGAALMVIAALPTVWWQLHAYQRNRIEVFLNSGSDPLGAGYHIAQSKIALGSGGFTGKGFLQGTQGQLSFLPEKHTDFVFTSIGEEWGFVGTAVVLMLFGLLLVLLTMMALRCISNFGRLAIAGAALIIFGYVFVNVAMVSGLIPVVGVPLPLVSFGGTAMMTVALSIGIAMCAYVHRGQLVLRRRLSLFW